MRFWDSSALVPLVIEEPSSRVVESIAAGDPEIAVWWATRVECEAAIARQAGGLADAGRRGDAADDLADLASGWIEVPPGERLRDLAVRSARIHDLRAGDALQLAAAIVASENRPETLDLVTLDERLALAARREGFTVLPG